MSEPRDTMELPEPAILAHYPAALGLLTGFDHAPRLGKATAAAPQAAFWLISHTDRTMKDFAEIKKSVDLLLKEKDGQP